MERRMERRTELGTRQRAGSRAHRRGLPVTGVPSARRFAPGWKLSLFTAVFLPLLLGLGAWQLERGRDKAVLEARIADRMAQPARSVEPAQLGAVEAYAPVIVRGRYRTDRRVLLDNRTHQGRAGYELLVPLMPLSGEGPGVLVNLGWLPAPRSRAELPAPTLPTLPVSVRGTVASADAGAPVFGAVAEGGRWPLRVQRIEPGRIAELAGLRLVEPLLVAAPGSPGGRTHTWAPVRMSADTHYGYAAQWFGLATVLALGWLIASLPRRRRGAEEGDDDD